MNYIKDLEDGNYICIEDFIFINKESDYVYIDYEGELIELIIKGLNKKMFKQSYKEILRRRREDIVMLEIEGKGSDLRYVIYDAIEENNRKIPTESLLYLEFFSKAYGTTRSEIDLEASVYEETDLSYIIIKEIIREKMEDNEVYRKLV